MHEPQKKVRIGIASLHNLTLTLKLVKVLFYDWDPMSSKNANDDSKAKKDALLVEIETIRNRVLGLEKQVKAALDNINNTQNNALANIKTITDSQAHVTQTLQQIATMTSQAEQKTTKIGEYYDSVFTTTKDEQSYEDLFNSYLAEVKNHASEIANTAIQVKRSNDELFGTTETKYRKIQTEDEVKEGESLVKESDGTLSAASKIKVIGKTEKIQQLQNEMLQFLKDEDIAIQNTIKSWGAEYETLKERVNGLLPGAAAAGLSNAYSEAKKEHAEKAGKWEGIFGASIAVMIVVPLLLVTPDLLEYYRNGANFLTWDYLKIKSIHMLPFMLPALWFVYHANKVTNEHRRLRDEYTHKWAVSNTYVGLKGEIAELQEENAAVMAKLIQNTIEMHAENPTAVLAKETDADNPILKIIDRIIPKNIDKLISKFGLSGYSEVLKGSGEIIAHIADKGDEQNDIKNPDGNA